MLTMLWSKVVMLTILWSKVVMLTILWSKVVMGYGLTILWFILISGDFAKPHIGRFRIIPYRAISIFTIHKKNVKMWNFQGGSKIYSYSSQKNFLGNFLTLPDFFTISHFQSLLFSLYLHSFTLSFIDWYCLYCLYYCLIL